MSDEPQGKKSNSRGSSPPTKPLRIAASRGQLDACRECSGRLCCGDLAPGGPIEPPFLTEGDIATIERATGRAPSSFAIDRLNAATGNEVSFMRTHQEGGCVFFDRENGRCGIYAFRPIDCRLFPLDIDLIDGKYHWVRHQYMHCDLTPGDDRRLLENGKAILPLLEADLADYATVPVPGMVEVGYEVLSEVEIDDVDSR